DSRRTARRRAARPSAALHARLAERIEGARRNGAHADELLAVAGRASIALTDGRTATARAAQTGVADLVLVDLARDYAQAESPPAGTGRPRPHMPR
ncbi:hypothetical protein KPA92_36170, partial [Burkholderia cenocepacia]|nr:hypothetical protein [Burkholderia cenocepacia]